LYRLLKGFTGEISVTGYGHPDIMLLPWIRVLWFRRHVARLERHEIIPNRDRHVLLAPWECFSLFLFIPGFGSTSASEELDLFSWVPEGGAAVCFGC
jgi:hypothetical protein